MKSKFVDHFPYIQIQRRERMEKMAELISDNVNKSCVNALKKTATNFSIKPNAITMD